MGKPNTKKKIILKKVKPVPNSVYDKLTKRGVESLRRSAQIAYLQSPENLERSRKMRQAGYLGVSRRYRPYDDAQKFVKKLKLKSFSAWFQYASSEKLPKDIPVRPDFSYGRNRYFPKPVNNRGWIDYETWLGLKPRKYRSFENARKIARSLKITSIDEWNSNVRMGVFPKDIPESPDIYDKFRGWYDFFGHDKNTPVDRKLRFEYRILFDKQLNYFHNLNRNEKNLIKVIMDSLNFDDVNFDDMIYNEMKLSLPSRANFDNSQMILAESNSYVHLKNAKFVELILPNISRKEKCDIYKNLETNSIATFGDLINSESIPSIGSTTLNNMKCHAIGIIFGNKIGETFGKYLNEYNKIFVNLLNEVYKDDEILKEIEPLKNRVGVIARSKTKIVFEQNPEVIKLLKKILKIINKAKIKKYKIGKTRRSVTELLLLRMKWSASSVLNQYDEMSSLENELLNNPDLGYKKSEIYSNFAICCLRIGKISKSLFYNQKATDAEPDDPNNWFNKACIYAMSGDVDFACNSLLVAVGLGGNKIISDAKKDVDFSKIKNSEQFKKIIKSSKKKLFGT